MFGVKRGSLSSMRAEQARWLLRVGAALTTLWIVIRGRPSRKD
jgi:hypothetical protein